MSRPAAQVEGGFVVKRSTKRSLGRVHTTFDGAGAEAARLVALNHGEPFSILQVVGIAGGEVTR